MSHKKTKKASLKKGSRKITGKVRRPLKSLRMKGAAERRKRRAGAPRKRLMGKSMHRKRISREYQGGYEQGYREGHAKGFEDAHQETYMNHSGQLVDQAG
ncbi:hypothetical protein DFP97_11379 [Paenibacillus prosopidis]|uniref:Uncharacterized protein n=1 Tax=Paenibacillus prosopidis TaxID=630520 RepID=A0A368VSG3_9BACL|nr:hypothetical protein DFP97_11379 [Paenibacillus prosopidis]